MSEQITILAQVYNTLLTVSTKGEDTVTMAQCLTAMREAVMNLQQMVQEQAVAPVEGE